MPARVPGIRPKAGGWEARIKVAGRAFSRFFTNYEEAVRWRNKQAELSILGRNSDHRPSARMSFGEHWERWRETSNKRPNTIARYDSAYRCYIEQRWAKSPIGHITRSDAQEWVRDLQLERLAPATILKLVQITSACMQRAVDDDILDKNPFRRLELPELPDEEARFVTLAEAHKIEQAIDPWWSLTIPFLMDTGLRISELCGLRVGDVTFNKPNWVVHVRQIVTEPGGKLMVGPPKTKAGVRTIPTITPSVAKRVAEHIAERDLGANDFLYAGMRGGTMRPSNWRSRVFDAAVERSGIEDSHHVTPHSLRRGAVAVWIAAGVVDAYKLSRWLGHRSPATVTQLYGHLIPENTAWVTDTIEAMRGQAASDHGEPVELRQFQGQP